MKFARTAIVLVLGLVMTAAAFVPLAQSEETPTVIVLAMHGNIPSDFPKADLARYFKIHQHSEAEESAGKHHSHVGDSGHGHDHKEAHALEQKLRNWPRNKTTDPFYWGSVNLQKAMSARLGAPVLLSFNEFCAPTIEDAIQAAVEQHQANRVLVVTPMLTQGGGHSEKDIPRAIERAKRRLGDSNVAIDYVWPVAEEKVAAFLAEQVDAYLPGHGGSRDATRSVPAAAANSSGPGP